MTAEEEPEKRSAPTTGGIDELLVDPPERPRGGSIEGYRSGRWMRTGFALLVAAAVGGGIWAWKSMHDQRAAEQSGKPPVYEIVGDDGGAGRPRQLVWSAGEARLGLSREPPGVEEIVLPDRRIRLADGCDHAQLKVIVQGDRTVTLKVLVGDIVELPPDDRESSPAPPAKAP